MEGHPNHSHIGREFGLAVVGLGEGKGLGGHPELKVLSVCDKNATLEAVRASTKSGKTECIETLDGESR